MLPPARQISASCFRVMPCKSCNKRKALGKTYDSNRKCTDEAPASVYLPSSRRFPPLFVPHSSTRALTLNYHGPGSSVQLLTLDSVFLQKLCTSTLVPRQVDLSFTQCLAPRWTPQAPDKTETGHDSKSKTELLERSVRKDI